MVPNGGPTGSLDLFGLNRQTGGPPRHPNFVLDNRFGTEPDKYGMLTTLIELATVLTVGFGTVF